MGKHLEQALPSVYTLQCLTGKVDNNNDSAFCTICLQFSSSLIPHAIRGSCFLVWSFLQGRVDSAVSVNLIQCNLHLTDI